MGVHGIRRSETRVTRLVVTRRKWRSTRSKCPPGPGKTCARTRSQVSQPHRKRIKYARFRQDPTTRSTGRPSLERTRSHSQLDLTMTCSRSGVPQRLTIRLTHPNGYERDLVRERKPPKPEMFSVDWDATKHLIQGFSSLSEIRRVS